MVGCAAARPGRHSRDLLPRPPRPGDFWPSALSLPTFSVLAWRGCPRAHPSPLYPSPSKFTWRIWGGGLAEAGRLAKARPGWGWGWGWGARRPNLRPRGRPGARYPGRERCRLADPDCGGLRGGCGVSPGPCGRALGERLNCRATHPGCCGQGFPKDGRRQDPGAPRPPSAVHAPGSRSAWGGGLVLNPELKANQF